MIAYFKWFCMTFIGNGWEKWYTVVDKDTGFGVLWPLAIFAAVHLVALLTAWRLLVYWLYVRKSRAWWFAEGFAAGAHSKAVRLGQIKFSKDPSFEEGCILWNWDKSLEAEVEARYASLRGILGATCKVSERGRRHGMDK